MADLKTVRRTLKAHGQEHLLRFYDGLSKPQQTALREQLAGIDFARVDEYVAEFVHKRPAFELPEDVQPPEVVPAHPTGALAGE